MLRSRRSCSPNKGAHISRSPTRQPCVKGGSYDCELIQIMRERDEMHGMLGKYERHLSEIQGNVKVLTADRDKTAMLYQQAQEEIAQLHRELLRSKQTSSPRSSVTAQNILKRVGSERDEAAADLRRMTMERDSLRERLKISHETSISERAHLEQRVEDQHHNISKLEQEIAEERDRQATLRDATMNLEEEIHTMALKMAATEEELNRANAECSMLRLSSNQMEAALTDTQNKLSTQTAELRRSQGRSFQLEEQNESMLRQLSDLRQQLATQKTSVDVLNQSREDLQEQLELKSKLLSSANQELELKSGLLSSANQQLEAKNEILSSLSRELELKSEMLSSANQQLEMKSELHSLASQQLDDKEKSLRCLELSVEELKDSVRRLQEMQDQQEQNLEGTQKAKEVTLRENRQLQDNLNKARLNSQTLQFKVEDSNQEVMELKRKIQSYVADASRVQRLLVAKEKECQELQEDRRCAEEEVQQAETAAEEAHVELLSSETEKRRLQGRAEDLEAKLQEAQRHLHSCRSEVELLRRQLSSERLSLRSLEATLLSSCRMEMEQHLSSPDRSEEIEQLRDQLAAAESRASSQNREVIHLKTWSAHLEADLKMTKKQLEAERLEREQAVQELRHQGLSPSPLLAGDCYNQQASQSPQPDHHSAHGHLGYERSPVRGVTFQDLHY
ncbi:testis-specific gene 10 protein isoform X2 [Brienomyrus brachyistius]|uniref:testis-specific gene 10 protein isoform X2 n=1 Tax=Brienomyrus brachyistius TaxID=42636 RepID=UPI0020B42BC3|nr:testis-specific gene 10 protein isoform X2 [Brienomyrus brachyistius]